MIGLLQRVSEASVSVSGDVIASIGRGLLVLVAVEPDVAVPTSRFGATAFNTLFGPAADLSPIAAHAFRYPNEVLFLASECNTFLGAAFQREQMRLFAHARLATIPNAGHEMFSENPTESLRVVRAYLSE